MIPIGDSVRARTFPYVNITIIAINIIVFLYELTLSALPTSFFPALPGLGSFSELDLFFFDWGTMPACLGDRFGFQPDVNPLALGALCPGSDSVLLAPFTATWAAVAARPAMM